MSRNPATNDHPTVRLAWSADRHNASAPPAPHLSADHPADELFTALDGRPFRFFETTWRLKIYSIYDQDDYRWLQVSLEGRPPRSTTLRVSIDASADDVIGALTNWLLEARATRATTGRVH
jgi:hypothetical protein